MWKQIQPSRWGQFAKAAYRPARLSTFRERSVRPPSAVRGSSTTTMKTHYDILGIEKTASADDIKSAFRRQAKLVHPDVSKLADSEEEFKQLKEAYDVLSDVDQRAEYDEALERPNRRRSSSSSSGGSVRRTVIIQEDPWGLGGATVVIEEFGDSGNDGDGFLEDMEFMSWAVKPGKMRSSSQSSYKANSLKNGRRARQQQAAMTEELSGKDKNLLLKEMPPNMRVVAQQVFGAKLQALNRLEELTEFMEAVEAIEDMGVQFDFNNESEAGEQDTPRGSRRQGFGSGRSPKGQTPGKRLGSRRRQT